MKKISETFAEKKPLFIPFIMAGCPHKETAPEAIIALSEAGADVIELGVPFSDPVADGPVNQKAADIALKNGMTLELCLEQVKQVQNKGCKTPIVLFSYLNPIYAMGAETFAKRAKECGVSGVLIVDLPLEEGEAFYEVMQQNDIEFILLASPTTEETRLKAYDKLKMGFLYYVSRLGVTGAQTSLSNNLETEIRALRKTITNNPIAVGFGISTPEQARTVASFSDGVIVGSCLVQILMDEGVQKLKERATEFVEAINLRPDRLQAVG